MLAKLGRNQFNDGDLRLLVIYASFAAQAMANADSTEQLRRQLQEEAARIEGIWSVRNLLHLPGEAAPDDNVQAVFDYLTQGRTEEGE